MPRKATFTREEVVQKALQLVREKGAEAVTARSLGAQLGTSSSPIFTLFASMDEVMAEARKEAFRRFDEYVADVTDYLPAFKEFGMRLLRFAQQQSNMFHFLFLQRGVVFSEIPSKALECLNEMELDYQITSEQAQMLFQQMWVYVCGLTMQISKQEDLYTEERMGEMLSTQFVSTLMFIKSGRPVVNVPTHLRQEGEKMTMKM